MDAAVYRSCMARRAQRSFLNHVDPARRESLKRHLEAGAFDPPAITSFTMTGTSSLYLDGGTVAAREDEAQIAPVLATAPVPRRASGETFERLTRKLANTTSRRQALKVLGGAAAAAVGAAVLKPAGMATAAVSCPSGQQPCGAACCPPRYTCSTHDAERACCCKPGTAPCGPTCCPSGVACVDRTRGRCGCPAGTTPCGTSTRLTCCPAGTACPGANSTACPAANSAVATVCVATDS
jgi:hypothetical protein